MNAYLVTVLLTLPGPAGPVHYEAARQWISASSDAVCQVQANAAAERARQVFADAVRRGAIVRGVCTLQGPLT